MRSTPARLFTLLGIVLALIVPASRTRGQDAEGLSASFRTAARRVLPAVVTVQPIDAGFPIAPRPRPLGLDEPVIPRNPGGSGVVIDARRGLVLTNDHVVQGRQVVVTLPDGRERAVSRVLRDPRSDLALLVINPEGLTAADWGDSEALDIGDWVLAVGQPFGLSGTVTAGIVSGKGRGIGAAVYEDLIQTDAAINPGNSGGPLVNLKGQIIGINTAIKSINGSYEGVGFAVPASRARHVANDLAEFGRVRRVQIGVRIGRPVPRTSQEPSGVPILAVGPLSPAAEAGLRTGDLILKIGDRPVTGTGMLQGAIEMAPEGEPLTFTVLRGDQTIEVKVRPAAIAEPGPIRFEGLPQNPPDGASPEPELRPESRPPPPEPPAPAGVRNPSRFPDLGLRLAEQAAGSGSESAPAGVIVRGVEPQSPADRGGLEIGMVITDVAGRRIETLADLRAALANRPADRDLILHVLKGKKAEFRVILNDHLPRSQPAQTPEEVAPPAIEPPTH